MFKLLAIFLIAIVATMNVAPAAFANHTSTHNPVVGRYHSYTNFDDYCASRGTGIVIIQYEDRLTSVFPTFPLQINDRCSIFIRAADLESITVTISQPQWDNGDCTWTYRGNTIDTAVAQQCNELNLVEYARFSFRMTANYVDSLYSSQITIGGDNQAMGAP